MQPNNLQSKESRCNIDSGVDELELDTKVLLSSVISFFKHGLILMLLQMGLEVVWKSSNILHKVACVNLLSRVVSSV